VPGLPKALRRLTPDKLRDNVKLRAFAVGAGLIPPRNMHAPAEAELLKGLASESDCVVEVGVYEGSSAVELIRAMRPGSHLHLIDPFGLQPGALQPGHAATKGATTRVTARAARKAKGPEVHWHVETSEETAAKWNGDAVDLVFIDGDHLEDMVALDWEVWNPHVRIGGHVLFHDSREGVPGARGLPGPTAVVERLFRSRKPLAGWSIAAEAASITAVRRDA
jgi:hypothetical protein